MSSSRVFKTDPAFTPTPLVQRVLDPTEAAAPLHAPQETAPAGPAVITPVPPAAEPAPPVDLEAVRAEAYNQARADLARLSGDQPFGDVRFDFDDGSGGMINTGVGVGLMQSEAGHGGLSFQGEVMGKGAVGDAVTNREGGHFQTGVVIAPVGVDLFQPQGQTAERDIGKEPGVGGNNQAVGDPFRNFRRRPGSEGDKTEHQFAFRPVIDPAHAFGFRKKQKRGHLQALGRRTGLPPQNAARRRDDGQEAVNDALDDLLPQAGDMAWPAAQSRQRSVARHSEPSPTARTSRT